MRRGQNLSPLTAPADKSDDDVVPVWGVIVFGGATAAGAGLL